MRKKYELFVKIWVDFLSTRERRIFPKFKNVGVFSVRNEAEYGTTMIRAQR